MASYSIRFKPSVEKDLLRLPKDIVPRVWDRIENLKSDPFSHQASKLSGAERLYRIRVGDYRLVYEHVLFMTRPLSGSTFVIASIAI